MKINWSGIIFWFAVYYFLNNPLEALILGKEIDLFTLFDSWYNFVLIITGMFSFFFFGFIPYLGFILFFEKRKYFMCALFIVLGLFLPVFLRYFIQEILTFKLFGIHNYNRNVNLVYYVYDNLYYGIRFISFGIVYYFIQYSFHKAKIAHELEVVNEKTKLAMLRHQVNPHFLLNSLNNIYSLVFHKSDKSLQAIEELGDILKYALYEKNEKVTLSTELESIDKIINLSKLRYDYPIQLKIDIANGIENVKIPPLIIFPLVENIFKHGDLRNSEHPAKLTIRRNENDLLIQTSNKVQSMQKDSTGGIGLENIKQRLQLLFAGAATFQQKSDNETFEVNILIPIA